MIVLRISHQDLVHCALGEGLDDAVSEMERFLQRITDCSCYKHVKDAVRDGGTMLIPLLRKIDYFGEIRETTELTNPVVIHRMSYLGVKPHPNFKETHEAEALVHAIPGIDQKVYCPKCPVIYRPYGLDRVIIHLNDDHRWTREEIADWLETLDEVPGW